MPYLLSDYRLDFTPDHAGIQIVSRAQPSEVVAKLPLNGGEVEVIVDIDADTLEIVALADGLPEPFELAEVDCTANPYFGLDAIFIGGIGISDIRDNYRLIHAFDLKQCRLTFSLTAVNATQVMRMKGKGHTGALNFYSQLVRKQIHNPI